MLRFFPCPSCNTLFPCTTALFYLRLFYGFCFTALCLFTRFLNLCSITLGLTPFGWFICIYFSLFFNTEKSLDLRPLFRNQLGRKTRTCGVFYFRFSFDGPFYHVHFIPSGSWRRWDWNAMNYSFIYCAEGPQNDVTGLGTRSREIGRTVLRNFPCNVYTLLWLLLSTFIYIPTRQIRQDTFPFYACRVLSVVLQ